MSFENESKIQACIFCYKSLCISDLVTVNDDALALLKILNKNIDTNSLQHSLLCSSCLENINAACKFKTSIEHLQCDNTSVGIKDEFTCDDVFVTCFTCRNNVKQTSAVSLLEYSYIWDVVTTFILNKNLEVRDDTQLCETCQISLLNLHSILDLLVNYTENKANVTLRNDNKQTIKYEQAIENNVEVINDINKEIKNEEEMPVKDVQAEINNQEFQIKQEELDLKIDCEEEESDEGVWTLDQSDQSPLNKAKTTKRQRLAFETNDKVEIYFCQLCEYHTKYKGRLKQHTLTHRNTNETKIFRCQQCEYKTKYKHSLKKHLLTHKGVDETEIFKCDQCEFQTKYRYNLRSHMLLHKGVGETKIFQCDKCEYRTVRKRDLCAHARVHKDVSECEIFSCPQCKFQTRFKNNVKKHMLIHKNVGETEMFVCRQCGHKTKYKYSLKKHLLTHKGIGETEVFLCDKCEYRTVRKGDLFGHAIVHKDVSECEIFRCLQCKFQSKYKRSLRQHICSYFKKCKN